MVELDNHYYTTVLITFIATKKKETIHYKFAYGTTRTASIFQKRFRGWYEKLAAVKSCFNLKTSLEILYTLVRAFCLLQIADDILTM